MNDKMNNIKKALDTSVFKETKFTEENKEVVFEMIAQKNKRMYMLPMLISSLFVAIIGTVGIYFAKDIINNENKPVSLGNNQAMEMQILEENGNVFLKFTEIEKQAYNNFKLTFDLNELANLEPISIAKFYIYAGYYQDYELQYALYTDKEGHIQWSEEEDKNIPISHRANQEQIIETYKNLEKGTFVQTSENEGYIKFNPSGINPSGNDEEISGFSMIKNDNGIWQVAFTPIQ